MMGALGILLCPPFMSDKIKMWHISERLKFFFMAVWQISLIFTDQRIWKKRKVPIMELMKI